MLATWIDMNAPAYGTWLEIPTVRDREQYLRQANPFSLGMNPLPVSEIERFRQRRIEFLRRYGGVEDDGEAVPELPQAAVTPVIAQAIAPAESIQIAGWPFDADEAKRRQASAGRPFLAEKEAAGKSALPAETIELASGVKMDLVLIPAGEFVMGDASEYADERPSSRVKIDRPFWMGKFEVTNQQYAAFDPMHDSGVEPMLWLKWHPGHLVPLNQPQQPVCRGSWHEARAFCDWLSRKTAKKFALPNEAQWEWACRAGTDTAMSFVPVGADSSSFANLADASLLNLGKQAAMEKVKPFFAVEPIDDKQTVSAPVGSFQPNSWGLFDMHGNAAEWTASADSPYPFRADDPRHAVAETRKSVRGGSWNHRADLARSASRTSHWPWQRVFNVGFRVICKAE